MTDEKKDKNLGLERTDKAKEELNLAVKRCTPICPEGTDISEIVLEDYISAIMPGYLSEGQKAERYEYFVDSRYGGTKEEVTWFMIKTIS